MAKDSKDPFVCIEKQLTILSSCSLSSNIDAIMESFLTLKMENTRRKAEKGAERGFLVVWWYFGIQVHGQQSSTQGCC